MTVIEELRKKIELDDLSVTIYFKLKDNSIKLADIDKDLENNLLALYKTNLEKEVINKKDLEIIKLTDADERKNVIYKYDFELIEPFISINSVIKDENIEMFSFSKDKFEEIDGIIAKIGTSQEQLFFYSKFYAVNLFKQNKAIRLIKSDERIVEFTKEVIQINGKFDIIAHNKEFYILKYDILERYYSFDDVVKKRVKKEFEKIKALDIISSDTKILNYLNENISKAKKLIKVISSSKVIQKNISKELLIKFVSEHENLKPITINKAKDKFILESKVSFNLFIKLLDDDFLKSELTDEEYDAIAKNAIKK